MIKNIQFFLVLCGLWAHPLWAHEAPVPVNDMRWIADPGILHVRLDTGAPWWVTNVLGEATPSPTHWPLATQTAIKDYFDNHFSVRADGKVLTSQLVGYRYSEEVYHYYLGSRLMLEFDYALPTTVSTLSGSASFYKEDLEQASASVTHLSIDGAPQLATTLKPDQPTFSFVFNQIVRSHRHRWRDDFVNGLLFWQAGLWLVVLFTALQLQLRTRLANRIYILSLGLAGVMMGVALGHTSSTSGFAIGVFSALALYAACIHLGLHIYLKRLYRFSQSQAQALFIAQVRFVSLLLVGITFLLMASALHPS